MITSQLDADEVVALTLAVEVASATSNTPFGGAANRALAKIEASLPAKRAEQLQLSRERIVVSHSPHNMRPTHREIDESLVGVFEEAFTTRSCFRFGYIDRHGESTTRKVEPQGLLVRPPVWYVIGWDPKREGFRHFRADRITNPELTKETFSPRTLETEWTYNAPLPGG